MGGLGHGANRVLEDLPPLHLEEMAALADHGLAQRDPGSTGGPVEKLPQVPVGSVVGRHDTSSGAVGRLQDGGAGAVPEEHSRGPVVPVQDGAHLLGGDDEGDLPPAGCDIPFAHGEPVEPAATRRHHVEGQGVGATEQGLGVAGGGREPTIRRGCGDHQDVHLAGPDAGSFQGAAPCLGGHVARPHALRGDAPGTDSGAGPDPLVGRVHPEGQIVVGDDVVREEPAGGHDLHQGGRVPHAFSSVCPGAASSRVMWTTMFDRTARAATPKALRMARADDSPWQMMETPPTPRSGAPPYSA